ncbi:MAG TPA: methyltransferase domain-containing protein [Terriglobales bacterium]|nr:methyltransferase domain-containing protein [Terriglobales bacterium]
MKPAEATTSAELKQCCANLYESDFAKFLLGDSFHPGGLRLTERLGQLLQLDSDSQVLDLASGTGTSAMFIAQRFGCEVVGLDYGQHNVERANAEAADRGLSGRVRFERGDAESSPFPDSSFDAVVCECAFCTFPDKPKVAGELARVLRSGGGVGISDLTRAAELPKELAGLLAWIACIADAQPVGRYVDWLLGAGLTAQATESHDDVLIEMVRQIQAKLLATEIMTGLKKIDLPGLDLASAKQMARAALSAIQQGQLGYAIITARKP